MRPEPIDPVLPRWVGGVALLALLAVLLPLVALVGRVQVDSLWADLTSPAALSALRLSLVTSLAATALCTALGVPLALALARGAGRWEELGRTLVLVPLVLPPMVGGLALVSLLGRSGLLGGPLHEATGWSLPYTTGAVVVAQVFVALPFLVITLEGALRSRGLHEERVAASLGASPWRVLTRVTLPAVAPALANGIVLTWARATGEFGATALFAGNLEGSTRTMPLAIYTAFSSAGVTQGAAVALSVLLLASSVVVVLGLRRLGRPA